MIGKFIVLEGTDGSGKTTMLNKIKDYLESKNFEVVTTREPGGVDISEKIRNIILNNNIDAKTEALLFAASRREHLLNKIIPAINKGKIVICDRFVDSSIAYQVYGRGLEEKEVVDINNYILEGRLPDIIFYFDVDIKKGLERTESRQENNKLDNENYKFYENVKKGYDSMKKKYKDNLIIIDANLDLQTVEKNTLSSLERLLDKWKITT